MIRLDHVSKRYPPGIDALTDVGFEVGAGELVAIGGHSGAGKSTLLKLIAAIERPTGGAVLVNGQNVGGLKRNAVPYLRRNLGLVFQDQKLLFDRNAFENVMLPLAIAGYAPAEAKKRVHAALDKVGLLAREKAMPIMLSGGEQQRLAIARAVVTRPDILLADEPTGDVEHEMAMRILRLFVELNRLGATVLIASHDEEMVVRSGRPVLHLSGGRLTRRGGEAAA